MVAVLCAELNSYFKSNITTQEIDECDTFCELSDYINQFNSIHKGRLYSSGILYQMRNEVKNSIIDIIDTNFDPTLDFYIYLDSMAFVRIVNSRAVILDEIDKDDTHYENVIKSACNDVFRIASKYDESLDDIIILLFIGIIEKGNPLTILPAGFLSDSDDEDDNNGELKWDL